MAQREVLRGQAAAGEPADVGVGDAERPHECGGVVGHVHDGEAVGRHRRPTGTAVVERGDAIAVGEPVELERPRLGGVGEPGDQDDVGSRAALVDPQLDVADADVADAGRGGRRTARIRVDGGHVVLLVIGAAAG
jgi:hypothetical protein